MFLHEAHPVFNSDVPLHALCKCLSFYTLGEYKISPFAFPWQTSVHQAMTHFQGKWRTEWKWVVNNVRFVCENTVCCFSVGEHVWQWTPVYYSIAQRSVCKQGMWHWQLPMLTRDARLTPERCSMTRFGNWPLLRVQYGAAVASGIGTFDAMSYSMLRRMQCSVASALKYLKYFF